MVGGVRVGLIALPPPSTFNVRKKFVSRWWEDTHFFSPKRVIKMFVAMLQSKLFFLSFQELSEKAISFILRCFEPDPDKRATSSELLDDPFITE